MKRFFLSIIPLLFTSCGYQVLTSQSNPPLLVPFVEGDNDGRLTNAIICAIQESGLYNYSLNDKAKYRLNIRLETSSVETLGYQYRTRNNDQDIENRLIENEGRRNVCVSLTLIDQEDGKTLWGPEKISAFSDFDYVDPDSFKDLAFIDQNNQLETVLNFSLGQLDSQEGATSSSISPAYQKLAQKITDVLARNFP